MNKQLQGVILVIIGVIILFPQAFSFFLLKFILALYLIVVGLQMMFKEKSKGKNE